MKFNRWFLVGIIAALLLTFGLQMKMPQHFRWVPTFSRYDKNPFGCYVFDSVAVQTLPHGYRVARQTLYQLDQSGKQENVLVVTTKFSAERLGLLSAIRMARRGSTVLIVTDDMPCPDSSLVKLWGMTTGDYFNEFNLESLQRMIRSQSENLYDTIEWRSRPALFAPCRYRVYGQLLPQVNGLEIKDSTHVHALAYDHYACSSLYEPGDTVVTDTVAAGDEAAETEDPASYMEVHWKGTSVVLAAERSFGKGRVIIAACPLLFSNYGILDPRASFFVHRMLSLMAGRPVVRTTAYMHTPMEEAEASSPFRYFLSQPPLRWALWLTCLLIVVFMVFTARRRQRVIPVVERLPNKSLEFVKIIGTLYYQQNNPTDLVRKKYQYFAEDLRRRLFIDVNDADSDDRVFSLLSRQSGVSYEQVAVLIHALREIQNRASEVEKVQMRQLIDGMNEILNNIS